MAGNDHCAFGTGLEALDRILGKGFVPGAAILVGGEPGIGKSTLLLQLAGAVAREGKTVLYASGEESLPQIRNRGSSLNGGSSKFISAYSIDARLLMIILFILIFFLLLFSHPQGLQKTIFHIIGHIASITVAENH